MFFATAVVLAFIRYVWMQIRPDPLRFSYISRQTSNLVKQLYDVQINLPYPYLSSSVDQTSIQAQNFSPFIALVLKLGSYRFEVDQAFFAHLNFLTFSATMFVSALTVRVLLRSNFLAIVTFAVLLTRGRLIQESYFFSELNFATCFFTCAFFFMVYYIRTTHVFAFFAAAVFLILFSACGDLYAFWAYGMAAAFAILAGVFRKHRVVNIVATEKIKLFVVVAVLLIFTFQILSKMLLPGQVTFLSILKMVFSPTFSHDFEMFERNLFDFHFMLSVLLLGGFYIFNPRLLFRAHKIWRTLVSLTFLIPLILYMILNWKWPPEVAIYFRVNEPLILAFACGMGLEKVLLLSKKGLILIKG